MVMCDTASTCATHEWLQFLLDSRQISYSLEKINNVLCPIFASWLCSGRLKDRKMLHCVTLKWKVITVSDEKPSYC